MPKAILIICAFHATPIYKEESLPSMNFDFCSIRSIENRFHFHQAYWKTGALLQGEGPWSFPFEVLWHGRLPLSRLQRDRDHRRLVLWFSRLGPGGAICTKLPEGLGKIHGSSAKNTHDKCRESMMLLFYTELFMIRFVGWYFFLGSWMLWLGKKVLLTSNGANLGNASWNFKRRG